METAELNQNGNFIENLSAEQLLSTDSSDACGVFGEPELHPRVDDQFQYQVEIPALITRHEYDCYLKIPTDAENKEHVPFDFLVGLPVPVTRINSINKEMEKLNHEKQNDSIDASNKKPHSIFASVRKTVDPYQRSAYCLVPGISGDSWNDIDMASFLLGLYIFEKKFVQLKRFVGCKKMEDILLFYYGKFYRSIEYRRWSASRKLRSRKSVYGQQIFSEVRQQELLSRLLPQVSEECQKALMEVSKAFNEGSMSLEEYVFSLKAMVGLKSFVEAVAIGKGKRDLTGTAIEPVKSNEVSHMRQEVPIGKACSSLTHTEIIKFLTGGYRLSKARSNDLFWEAVWPRLLARGWHSEQPKNQPYVPGAKHALVFLTPGITKFSRRKLDKGDHYFDSVTDVLSKVGSEPELIELDTERNEGKKNEENGWTDETKEQEKLPDKQRPCYLKPPTPVCSLDVMKFAIVDTSLANGKIFKFRELRNLPMGISKMSILPEDSEQGTSEVSTNGSDCAPNMVGDHEETNSSIEAKNHPDKGMVFYWNDFDGSSSDQPVHFNGLDLAKPVSKSKNKLYDGNQTKKTVKSHLSRRPKPNDMDNLASVKKQHRTITACSNEELSSGRSTLPSVPKFEEDVHGCCSDSHYPNNNAIYQVGSSQDRLSFTSSAKGSPLQSSGSAQHDDCHSSENPQKIPQFRTLIDLNLPQQPIEFEDGVFMTDTTNMEDGITVKQPENSLAPKTSADVTVPEQPADMNSRRQSTRNRPPTARALEALVNGYLTTAPKRKKDSDAYERSSRPPRRSRVEQTVTEFKSNNPIIAGESGTMVTDGGNVNMFKLEGLSHGNGPQISNP